MSRVFLFLQGPPGPFFSALAKGLTALGHRCLRVNLNGGDRIDWPGPAFEFIGTAESWPCYLADLLVREQVSDLVLFGDCRPLHHAARSQANAAGIAVHVFEEVFCCSSVTSVTERRLQ